jgi:poly(3-hydroxybutyrate) depolymerase
MSLRTSARPLSRLAVCPLLCGLATLAGAQQPQQPQQQEQGKKTAGRIEKRTYEFNAGKEMEHALFVPSTYDKEKKTPLLVALHG